jgi:hypothetical protein
MEDSVIIEQKGRNTKIVVFALGAFLMLVTLAGCGNPLAPDDSSPGVFGPRPARIELTDAAFTLVWDEPQTQVAEYRIYYRPHRRRRWTLLADGLPQPSLTVDTSVMEAGAYEFAVSYVCTEGSESVKHTSLDATADPGVGWYLEWNPVGSTGL